MDRRPVSAPGGLICAGLLMSSCCFILLKFSTMVASRWRSSCTHVRLCKLTALIRGCEARYGPSPCGRRGLGQLVLSLLECLVHGAQLADTATEWAEAASQLFPWGREAESYVSLTKWLASSPITCDRPQLQTAAAACHCRAPGRRPVGGGHVHCRRHATVEHTSAKGRTTPVRLGGL